MTCHVSLLIRTEIQNQKPGVNICENWENGGSCFHYNFKMRRKNIRGMLPSCTRLQNSRGLVSSLGRAMGFEREVQPKGAFEEKMRRFGNTSASVQLDYLLWYATR